MADGASRSPEAGGERELVRLCLLGDGVAQREMVRRYTRLVWSVCGRAGLPQRDAEDVAQEVFWSAFSALSRYRGECRLATWFYRIALRRVSDFHRSPSRRHVPSGAPASPGFPDVAASHDASPEAQACDAERRERVRAALDELAEPARSVLLAYYVGEMAVAEIARALAMPESTVKTHLQRGRRALRERLRDLC